MTKRELYERVSQAASRLLRAARTHPGRMILLGAVSLTLANDGSMSGKAGDSPEFWTTNASTRMRVQVERHHGTYLMGPLAGRNLGDLYGTYLGTTGTIPRLVTIDWDNRLDYLWELKLRRSRHNRVVAETARDIVASYQTAPKIHRLSIEDYQESLASEAGTLYRSLDWNLVCRMYMVNPVSKKVNQVKCEALKRAARNFGGRSLLAYSMTEILPSSEGKLNREYFDFVLRRAGREYIESLPAVYDPYLSFGPYQFTQYAVYDAGGRKEGASRVNVALPKDLRIPGSVAKLRGLDHVRAGYLFGIHNLALLIRRLNAHEFSVFVRVADKRALDIAEFLATAHNKPAVAISGARRWLDNDARSPYRISLPNVSRLYATKTYNNFRALSVTK